MHPPTAIPVAFIRFNRSPPFIESRVQFEMFAYLYSHARRETYLHGRRLIVFKSGLNNLKKCLGDA